MPIVSLAIRLTSNMPSMRAKLQINVNLTRDTGTALKLVYLERKLCFDMRLHISNV